ncbi:MAG: thioredoxin domain-containing protein [Candidatus Gracilibacteria bacterium]|nr:thioredoxin domain-containing protein [Candidatus Gracilibacteria bacterium]
MKKIFSFFILCSLIFVNFSVKTFANLDDYIVNNKVFYEMQLSKNIGGKKFVNLINKFIEINKNNPEKLLEINTKLVNIDLSKVKKADTINKVMYALAVINIALDENNNSDNYVSTEKIYDKLSITVYEDKRCTNCPTNEVIDQLKLLPSIASVEIERKDFAEDGVADYLTKNDIKTLPLIVFSTNNFDVSKDQAQMDYNNQPVPKVNTYLEALPEGGYSLAIGATFNPFEKRSERGFLLLDKTILDNIKEESYIKGNKDAKITWLEYSDLECPFCAKLHNSDTTDELTKKYGNDLNIIYNHFPLQFHENALPAAQILECVAEQKGSDVFYSLIDIAFKEEKSSKSYLEEQSISLGVNLTDLRKCVDDGKYLDKVNKQIDNGYNVFAITGTPGSILINNSTLEYEVISGAYPTSIFINTIDKLISK